MSVGTVAAGASRLWPKMLIPSEIAHHSDFKSPVIPK